MDVEVSSSEASKAGTGAGTGSPAPSERAALLAVAADPVRFALLEALTAGTTCVCELQDQVPVAANVLSYHLKVLREAGLISGAKRGRWIDYTLAADALDRLHAALPRAAHGGDRP
jgi:ArsR family transcriptional regulator